LLDFVSFSILFHEQNFILAELNRLAVPQRAPSKRTLPAIVDQNRMKKTIFLILFILLTSCGKQTQSYKMPIFAFSYIDSKNDYVIKYSGKDTLYLTDKNREKNYYSLLNNKEGKELSKIIVEIEKPEYFSYEEYGNVNEIYFRFSIIGEGEMPKSFPYRKDSEREMFKAASKVNKIKSMLNFVETEKEYMFTQIEDNNSR